MSRKWGDAMPGHLEQAEADVLKAEDDLAAAYRRVRSIEGEMAGYADMTMRISDWDLRLLTQERDRLGADNSGSYDLMGRYLAVLDEIDERKAANTGLALTEGA